LSNVVTVDVHSSERFTPERWTEYKPYGDLNLPWFIGGDRDLSDNIDDVSVAIECDPHIQTASGGCTPGYWKQDHHFDSWIGYTPGQKFSDVFGVGPANKTLLNALDKQVGTDAQQQLARHGAAALLNAQAAANGQYSYPFDAATVIQMVQSAWGNNLAAQTAHAQFEAANEGPKDFQGEWCPLN
jgi:hypothetical protein